jgi:hypothetical protein
MEKIMTITKDQFNNIRKARSQRKAFKTIIGIPDKVKYDIGDTAVRLPHDAKVNEIYKTVHKDKDYYYLVESIMGEADNNETLGFAWTLYPTI